MRYWIAKKLHELAEWFFKGEGDEFYKVDVKALSDRFIYTFQIKIGYHNTMITQVPFDKVAVSNYPKEKVIEIIKHAASNSFASYIASKINIPHLIPSKKV